MLLVGFFLTVGFAVGWKLHREESARARESSSPDVTGRAIRSRTRDSVDRELPGELSVPESPGALGELPAIRGIVRGLPHVSLGEAPVVGMQGRFVESGDWLVALSGLESGCSDLAAPKGTLYYRDDELRAARLEFAGTVGGRDAFDVVGAELAGELGEGEACGVSSQERCWSLGMVEIALSSDGTTTGVLVTKRGGGSGGR